MCVTLLLASLICLTLPGMLGQHDGLLLVVLDAFFIAVSPVICSVCRPLADVFVDGHHPGS